jgi:hypothetical protein
MNVIRAHDYLMPPESKPDFKALRRIMAGFIIATAISFCICVAMIIRSGRLMREHHPQHAAIHTPCRCNGQCMRH